jgi:hypothetical protein
MMRRRTVILVRVADFRGRPCIDEAGLQLSPGDDLDLGFVGRGAHASRC